MRALPLFAMLLVAMLLLAMLPLASPIAAQTSPQTGADAHAPTAPCDLGRLSASTPVRITGGSGPIPYTLACAVRGTCDASTLSPGLLVVIGQERDGYTCVSGGDSTSGWVPTTRLEPVPLTPVVPVAAWIGWWRQGADSPGIRNDRLHIELGKEPDTLHVTGRAYWYGLGDNIHTGEVDADAKPMGRYLHVVEGPDLAGCVLDLMFDPATHKIAATDNMGCGGLNVNFRGDWDKFKPAARHKSR